MTDSVPCSAPTEPTAVSVEWLSWHLREAGLLDGAVIERVRCEPLGESVGFLSQMARIVPEYAGTGKLQSMILKLGTTTENFRAVADRLRAFDREVGFYQHMAPRTPTRLAKVYAGSAEGGGGWMLMEDLSALRPGDQVHGLSNAQVKMAIVHIAAVHASNWCDKRLFSYDWLPEHDFYFRTDLSSIVSSLREHYELRIGRMGIELIEQVVEGSDRLDAAIAERPFTLVHGDLRADNLLLGDPGTEDEVLILDWQTATRSLGAIDVATLIGGSEPPPERAGHYHELFSGWLDQLAQHGVTHYTEEDALHDLRLALLSCIRIPLMAFKALGGPTFRNAREAQLADVLILRHTSAALDFDAAQAMP